MPVRGPSRLAAMSKLIVSLLSITPLLAELCVDVGSFAWPLTTGTFTPVTGSCQPKLLLMRWNTLEAFGGGASYSMGLSIATGPTARAAIYARSSDGTLNADARHSNASVLTILDSSAAISHAGDLVSFNTDGFTLNAGQVAATAPLVHWAIMGGTDLAGASLVQYQAPTATGTQPLSGAGFAADAVLVLTAGLTTAPPATLSNGDSWSGLGYAVRNPSASGATGVAVTHSVNTETRAQATGQVVYLPDTSAMRWVAAIQSWDVDGITLNWTTTQAAGIYFWVLYLKGPRFHVLSFSQPTATGMQDVGGISFQPTLGLWSSFCRLAASGQQTDGNWMHGWGISATKRAFTWSSMRSGNNNASRYASMSSAVSCLTENSSTPTLNSQADFVQWNPDGFRLNWTTVDTTAREILALLVGSTSTLSTPPRRRLIPMY